MAQVGGRTGEAHFELFGGQREFADAGPGEQRLIAAAFVVAQVVVLVAGWGF